MTFKSGTWFIPFLSLADTFTYFYLFVRYNQAIIFYQTGKLAYHSSKIWEQYDVRFRITEVRTTLAMWTPFPSRSCAVPLPSLLPGQCSQS